MSSTDGGRRLDMSIAACRLAMYTSSYEDTTLNLSMMLRRIVQGLKVLGVVLGKGDLR